MGGIRLTAPRGFLVRSSDLDALERSASGGAFWEFAKAEIADGGFVCGCAWDDNLIARHVMMDDLEGLKRLQGSKYVDSDISGVLDKVVDALGQGRRGLFCGTPCQCRAVESSVRRRFGADGRKELTIVALICHGCAMLAAWEAYKGDLERAHNAKLVDVCFRDKSHGYGNSHCTYTFVDENANTMATSWPSYLQDRFMYTTIVYNLLLQKRCYACKSKGLDQPFDLIVGDWYAADTGVGAKGSSCAIALSKGGLALVERCFPDREALDVDDIAEKNKPLMEHVTEPANNEACLNQLLLTRSLDDIERFFPAKYRLKKLLVKLGLFKLIKELIG